MTLRPAIEVAQEITGCKRASFNPYQDPRCAGHYSLWPCIHLTRATALIEGQAVAWDEGYAAGWSDGGDAYCAGLDHEDEHHNPYREETLP